MKKLMKVLSKDNRPTHNTSSTVYVIHCIYFTKLNQPSDNNLKANTQA